MYSYNIVSNSKRLETMYIDTLIGDISILWLFGYVINLIVKKKQEFFLHWYREVSNIY